MRSLTKKQLLALAGLVVLHIGLGSQVVGTGHTLTGETVPARSPQMLQATVTTVGVFFQLLALLLGSVAALVPYRGWPYRARLVTYFLTIALGLHLLFVVLAVSKLLWWG